MSIEIFIRLEELQYEAQPADGLEYPNASTSIHFARSDTHFTIWGSPEQWENLSKWAQECADARRKALSALAPGSPF
jgi:hypothetical protein